MTVPWCGASSLVELGFANVHQKRFELSTRVLRLAYMPRPPASGSSLQPFLDDLARSIKETVSVSVLDQSETVFIGRSDVPGRRLSYLVTAGMRLPAFHLRVGRVPRAPAHRQGSPADLRAPRSLA